MDLMGTVRVFGPQKLYRMSQLARRTWNVFKRFTSVEADFQHLARSHAVEAQSCPHEG
jgi:hypothetical protein